MNKKIKLLFIAKNIPVPKRKSNRIVFDIAKNISEYCDVNFLFPKEIVPFWLRNNKRFSYLYNLKQWDFEDFSIMPIPYIKLPYQKLQYWTLFQLPYKAKRYLIKNKNFDIIHAHYLFPDGLFAYKIFEKYKTPYVLTFRSQDRKYLRLISSNNPDFKKAYKIIANASKVLVTNGAFKSFVDSTFQINSVIIPHGIEKEVFLAEPKTKAQTNEVLITTVAHAIPRKNMDWVIRAFQLYEGPTQIKLKIVGDGPMLDELKNMAGNDERIAFLGRIERQEVLELLGDSHIFALPSINETFGLVYQEAAATHNAIIGHKEEGIWGVFEEDKEALFAGCFNSFKNLLFEVIDDKSRRESLSKNAFAKVRCSEWNNIIQAYHKIYKDVLCPESELVM